MILSQVAKSLGMRKSHPVGVRIERVVGIEFDQVGLDLADEVLMKKAHPYFVIDALGDCSLINSGNCLDFDLTGSAHGTAGQHTLCWCATPNWAR